MSNELEIYAECYHCHGLGTAPEYEGMGELTEILTCPICLGEKKILVKTAKVDELYNKLEEIKNKCDQILNSLPGQH